MPYELRRARSDGVQGWKVCKKDEKPAKCFSKKPLTKEVAAKQRVAIIISERQRSKKKTSS